MDQANDHLFRSAERNEDGVYSLLACIWLLNLQSLHWLASTIVFVLVYDTELLQAETLTHNSSVPAGDDHLREVSHQSKAERVFG